MNKTLRYCCKDLTSIYKYYYYFPQLLSPTNNDVQLIPKQSLTLKTKVTVNRGKIKQATNKTDFILFGPLIKKPKGKKTKHRQDEGLIPPQEEESIPNEKRESTSKQYKKSIPKPKLVSKQAAIPKLEEVNEVEKEVGGRLSEPDEVITLPRLGDRDTLQSENILGRKGYNLLSVEHTKWQLPSSTVNIREILSSPFTVEKMCDGGLDLVDDLQEIKKIDFFEGGYKKLPSVGAILRETMPTKQKEILDNWEKRKIEELGEEAFKHFQQGLIDRGKLLHECIEMNLGGDGEPNKDQLVGIEPFWDSIQHVLPKLSEIKVLESRVIHPTLHYQGCVDCVALFRDQLVVIDFKTSSKPKMNIKSTYDNPLQLMAYVGALNSDHLYKLPQVSGAILVVAYQSGLPAHIHHISAKQCSAYWSLWLERLVHYWKMYGRPIEI